MTRKERSKKAVNKEVKGYNVLSPDTAFFDWVNKAEDLLERVKDYQFADADHKLSWPVSKTVTYMDENSNARVSMKASTWKNIEWDISNKIVRNLKVITVGTPAKVSEDVLRFLTGN